jgi:hypothetical protein
VSSDAWNISQAKFNLEVGVGEEEPVTWWIPVTFKPVDSEEKTTFWLAESSSEVPSPANLDDNAFIFNVGELSSRSLTNFQFYGLGRSV